ncbi:hypothetical protein KY285_023501 [Solanum tuberosum]|nr:hypothetical protein KY285_023501 [Solanum tuberosum]
MFFKVSAPKYKVFLRRFCHQATVYFTRDTYVIILIRERILCFHFTTFQEFLGTNNLQCEYASPSVDCAEGASITPALTTPHVGMPSMEQPVSLSHMNIVGSRWVFKTKLKLDGSVERFKALFVARGYNQLAIINFQDTFSPVVKATTSRDVLSMATTLHWEINQLDIKNSFLHSDIKETT